MSITLLQPTLNRLITFKTPRREGGWLPIRISHRQHIDVVSVEHAVANVLILDQLADEVHDGGWTDPLTGVNSTVNPEFKKSFINRISQAKLFFLACYKILTKEINSFLNGIPRRLIIPKSAVPLNDTYSYLYAKICAIRR